MDHTIDASVLQACSSSDGTAGLPATAIEAVVIWLDKFRADDGRKWTLDNAYAMWSTYEQFGDQNHGWQVLREKFDREFVRTVRVPQSVSGTVTVPTELQYLDDHRQWLFAIASQRPTEISIANATHEHWYTKPPARKLAGVEIEQILQTWLESKFVTRQLAENTDSQHHYHVPPKQLTGTLAAAVRVGAGKNKRMAWEDETRRYEFDRENNTVEVYALGTGTWLHEARLDGTISKTTGGKGRTWGK